MWRTKDYTPLFNTQDFINKIKSNGGVDETFHNRILETHIFPKRSIVILERKGGIVRVKVDDYPSNKKLYTKVDFLEVGEGMEKEPLPCKDVLLKSLLNFPKIPYLLGGTIPFPINLGAKALGNPFEDRQRQLFGIDCSGLLYYVTKGNVVRNTADYLSMGEEVFDLKPLDLIYFKGHVIIYLGAGKCIESRQFDGVTISLWEERKKSIPQDYKFIRWYP